MGRLAGYPGQKLASTTFPVHDAIAGRWANADTFRRTGAEQRRCRQRRPLSSGSVVFAHGVGKNRGPAAASVTDVTTRQSAQAPTDATLLGGMRLPRYG